MGKTKLLFICTGNRDRSSRAEDLFRRSPDYEARSSGTSPFAVQRVKFKKIAHEAGVRGARISMQRLAVDDYDKVLHEAKACNAQSCITQYWAYDLRELVERAPAFLCKDQVPRSLKWSSCVLNGGDPNHNSL